MPATPYPRIAQQDYPSSSQVSQLITDNLSIKAPAADWEIHGGKNLFGTSPVIQRNGVGSRLYKLSCQNFDSTRFYLTILGNQPIPMFVGQSLTAYRTWAIDGGAWLYLDRQYWYDAQTNYQGVSQNGQLFPTGLWFAFSTAPDTFQPVPLTINFRLDAGGRSV
jgi:hypothetical protein